MVNYLYNIILVLDYLINVLTGGWHDEFISTRAHRLQHSSKLWLHIRRSIDWVAATIFRKKQHCFWSYVSDQIDRAIPPGKRGKYGNE